jgi:uncharacterized membrane protein YphA (DoxX/SURF4 family)
MNERVPVAVLLPLRLLVGAILVLSGYMKFTNGWLHGDALLKTLNLWTEGQKTYPFFIPVIETARAHPKIFGTLITMGELVVGASMVLGLLTRLFAVLGTLMVLSFALGGGQGLTPPGNALLTGAILFTFILAPPGRALGLDAALRAKLPRWLA